MSPSDAGGARPPAYIDKLLGAQPSSPSQGLFLHLGYWPDPSAATTEFADLVTAQGRLNDRLLALADLGNGMRVLDAGCGIGGTIAAIGERFQNMDLVGLNIDPVQLDIARKQVVPGPTNQVTWQHGDACALPFADASFDCILAVECIFHFPSRARFFAEAARVLKPGGRLVLSDFVVAPSLRAWRDSEQFPGFALEAALIPAVGPWPDFWNPEADNVQLAQDAGLEMSVRESASSQTLPSYRCFLHGKPIGKQLDAAQLDAVDRAMVLMQWLQERGHIDVELFSFTRCRSVGRGVVSKPMSRSQRRVALLCIDPAEDEGVLSLNYATRKVMAAMMVSPQLQDTEIHLVESRSKDAAEFVKRLDAIQPDIVGASGYVWSMATFVDVARQWKTHRPDSLFILGGPSARPRMLGHAAFQDSPRYIDAIVEGEGEEVMTEIAALPHLSRSALGHIPGIQVGGDSGWTVTAPRLTRADLGTFPSPYRMGLLARAQTALIETFRGCPFACTFCQWGDAKKLDRVFSAEYIAEELQALAGLDAKGAALIDAGLNLQPRAFKNLATAERQVGFFRERNFYCEVYPSHLSSEHLEFLEAVQADRISVGLQSFDQEVLSTLQRRFDENNFERVVRTLSKIVNLVTVEIIMGLPGDNPKSFWNTLERLVDLPCEARVFHCLVLPDALMDRAASGSDMVYDDKTLKMISCRGWSADDIRRMRDRLAERAMRMGGVAMQDWWEFPGPLTQRGRPSHPTPESHAPPHGATSAPPAVEIHSVSPTIGAALAAGVSAATGGVWELGTTQWLKGEISATLTTPEGPLVLEMAAATSAERSYKLVNGVAYRYRQRPGQPPSPRTLEDLDRLITEWSDVLPAVLQDQDRH